MLTIAGQRNGQHPTSEDAGPSEGVAHQTTQDAVDDEAAPECQGPRTEDAPAARMVVERDLRSGADAVGGSLGQEDETVGKHRGGHRFRIEQAAGGRDPGRAGSPAGVDLPGARLAVAESRVEPGVPEDVPVGDAGAREQVMARRSDYERRPLHAAPLGGDAEYSELGLVLR